jgi:serine protease Do
MKTTTLVGAAAIVAMLGASVLRPFGSTARAESRQDDPREQFRRFPDLMVLAGRGAEIGIQVTDAKDGGVVIEEVLPDSPAEKAGLKRLDVIVEFDGERVRSTRQFGRIVQETPPGRTVKATVIRGGQKRDVQVTLQEGRSLPGGRGRLGDILPDQQRELERMRGQLPRDFNFRFEMPDLLSGRRLGVTVDELSNQLAQYFGARDGVLVTSVTDGSPASRAGLKAGDVITSIDGASVRSRDDVVRGLRDAKNDEVRVGIVRDRKEANVVVSGIGRTNPGRRL